MVLNFKQVILIFFCFGVVKLATRYCNPGQQIWNIDFSSHPNAHFCQSCSNGYYCTGGNLYEDRCTTPSSPPCLYRKGGQCTQLGYYCTGSATSETSHPCEVGYYCPSVTQHKLCTAGYYCPNTKMTSVDTSNKCKAGYYCPAGSSTDEGSGFCSPGYYCPTGSSSATQNPCPAGKLCPSQGLSAPELDCTAGYYCNEASVTETGECSQGYYCTAGSSSATQHICPSGKICLEGTSVPADCQAGSYCPEGSYSQQNCGSGYYCSTPATKIICPSGNYCPGSRDTSPTICTAGKYCSGTGKTTVTGNCQAGYYCPSGSTSKTQIQCPAGSYCVASSASHSLCTIGSYCPKGSSTENNCGSGYYCSTTSTKTICPEGSFCSGSRETDHTLCTGGKYCSGTGNTAVSGDCQAGYYCPEGSSSKTENQCPAGSSCPSGSATHILCTIGSYCPAGSTAENNCGAGNYCSSTTSKTICPSGSYCPGNRDTSPTTCEAGKYCSGTGRSAVSGNCQAGYYCESGSSTATQHECSAGNYCPTGSSSQTTCVIGSYCPAGSSTEQACPKGSYCPNTASILPAEEGYYVPDTRSTKQTLCPAGKYCATTGLSEPTGNCQEGYYCPEGSTSATENQCLETEYCPTGSAAPQECECSNMGTCSQTDPTDCSCFEGSSGDQCEIFSCYGIPNKGNSSDLCSGNGFCSKMDNCDCNDGYYGAECESWTCFEVDKSLSTVCGSHGICNKYDVCECEEGYIGDDCSTSVAGSIVLPIVGAVTGSIFLVVICILLVSIPICFLIIKQKNKLKEFDKYEEEINMIKLEEEETAGGIKAKFSFSKKYLTVKQEEISLKKRLGAGSFAEVFLCEFSHADAVIKMFKINDIGSEESDFSDFEKELELLSSISHPNIISFLGASLKPPRLGILLEYCPNGDLSTKIDKANVEKARSGRTIPFKQKLDWLLQISSALSYLHKRGIIHRDLKLENVLLTNNDTCKLCDFGLSRAIEKNGKAKTMTKRVGTSIYIAPEVALGEKYDESCDAYSFSIMMYQLLTMKLRVYGTKDENGIEYEVAKKNLRPAVNEFDPFFSDNLWYVSLMKRCWSKEKSERPSMDEIQRIIKENYGAVEENNNEVQKVQPISDNSKESNEKSELEKQLEEMKKKMAMLENENKKLKKRPAIPTKRPISQKPKVPVSRGSKRLKTPPQKPQNPPKRPSGAPKKVPPKIPKKLNKKPTVPKSGKPKRPSSKIFKNKK